MIWWNKFCIGIRNLVTWFRVVWTERDWDYCYYEIMLLHKIRKQRKYFERHGNFIDSDHEVRWMRVCENLLDRLVSDYYWKNELPLPSRNGFGDNTYWPTRNLDLKLKFKTGLDSMFNRNHFQDLWEMKTRRLFWKIFVWRYERWWD